MSRPTPPLEPKPRAAEVVKGARMLNSTQKLVWLEDLLLDNGPDGSWIAAGGLAERLGVSRETIEVTRRELRGMGLLHSVQEPGRRSASWYPSLPPGCMPRSKTRPSVDEVNRHARLLDGAIVAARQTGAAGYAGRAEGMAQEATPVETGQPAQQATPVAESGMAYAATPVTEGGRGEETPASPVSEQHENTHVAVEGRENGSKSRESEEDALARFNAAVATHYARRHGPQPIEQLIPPLAREIAEAGQPVPVTEGHPA